MIRIIAAVDMGNLIGDGNKLPWHIPEELQHFRKITMGKIIIMGRVTWDSLSKKPLSGRRNIVVSSRLKYPGVECYSTPEEVINVVGKEDAFVIGGATLYKWFISSGVVNELIISRIKKKYTGNVYFPEIPHSYHLEEIITDDSRPYYVERWAKRS